MKSNSGILLSCAAAGSVVASGIAFSSVNNDAAPSAEDYHVDVAVRAGFTVTSKESSPSSDPLMPPNASAQSSTTSPSRAFSANQEFQPPLLRESAARVAPSVGAGRASTARERTTTTESTTEPASHRRPPRSTPGTNTPAAPSRWQEFMNILNSNAALETNVYYGGAQIARVTDTDLWMLMRTNEYGEPIEIMQSGYNSENPVSLLNFDALDPWEDLDMTPDDTGALPDAVDTLADADTLDTAEVEDTASVEDTDTDAEAVDTVDTEESDSADADTELDTVDTADAADAVDVDDDEVVVELSFTADDSTTEDSTGTASDDA
ncbi:hypothetical protein [Corynebacterium argentoratense]|uniref:hypothetical protein n=1 Tax=Corynebacterium argentoratense TaxID=42817 RepID=UPI0028EBA389|nr:hypothetical protein [Corynebacterium argentoratense]